MRYTTLLAALLIAPAALAQTAPVQTISTSPLVTTPGLPYGPAGTAATVTTTTTTAAPVVQAAPLGGVGLAKVFDEADTNRDNIVTREEFIAKANIHFGMADANKDNKITRPEMQAQQQSVMQQMQQNLFGNGNWQGKVQQFMGGGAVPVAPVNRVPLAPTVPAPIPPAAPTVTTY